jgi:hypothetical protein
MPVTAHPPFASAAAVVTALVLLARWWATPRTKHHRRSRLSFLPWHRPAPGSTRPAARFNGGPEHAQTPVPGAGCVLREAEEHLSRQWNRLQPLYLHHPDDSQSHSR